MELRSCEICKKIFKAPDDRTLCPRCMITHETEFKRVKEYLRKNPGTSMPILAEETDVDISVIEQYLKQERIEVAPNSPVKLACNKCSAEIVTGMYCENCSKALLGELHKIKNNIIAKEREEKGQLRYVTAKWRSK